MPVLKVHRYYRAEIRANPSHLYVFGDNMCRVGHRGQAREARDEPNAVGIPTLWAPGAFFSDSCVSTKRIYGRIDAAFFELRQHLANGGTVVLPADGVGTGLANLAERAPRILAYINEQLASLS